MKVENINCASYLIKHVSGVAVLLCLTLSSRATNAETLEVKLPSGITAFASYHQGLPAKPAVLIFPGFLQTNQSLPMNALAHNLSSKGYTVLSPTISLGVNKRSQSMACEAVQTHTMTEEIAEVDYWVKWLLKKGYKSIVPVGFSSSSNIAVLLYSAQAARPEIKRVILTSLNPVHSEAAERKKVRTASEFRKLAESNEIGEYSLGYCKNNFAATTASYLSYAQYDENKILQLIGQTSVPVDVILGSADTILPANWPVKLKTLKSSPRIVIIDNANHFFDGTNEFDLADAVANILHNILAQ